MKGLLHKPPSDVLKKYSGTARIEVAGEDNLVGYLKVNGVRYETYVSAGKDLGITSYTARSRCRSKSFPNYIAFTKDGKSIPKTVAKAEASLYVYIDGECLGTVNEAALMLGLSGNTIRGRCHSTSSNFNGWVLREKEEGEN